MPLFTDKNNILEILRKHPGQVRKLIIEQGFERSFEECIRESKVQGIQFRVLSKETFSSKYKGVKSHVCLERDDFTYTDPDYLLASVKTRVNPFFCAFDGVQDPQNLGNIVRSSACFDIDALIIPKDRACAVTETVANISRGAIEHVPVTRVTNLTRYLEALKKAGIFCYGLDEKGDEPLWKIDLKGPVCLVFGGEDGMRRLIRETCDDILKIPTNPAFPSLNVATCFALSAYEVKKQRNYSSPVL